MPGCLVICPWINIFLMISIYGEKARVCPHSGIREGEVIVALSGGFVSASGAQVRVGHAPPVRFSIRPCTGAWCEQVYAPRPGSDTTCGRRAQYTRDSRWCCTGTAHLRMLAGNLSNICVRSNHWHRFSRLCLYLAREQVDAVPALHN